MYILKFKLSVINVSRFLRRLLSVVCEEVGFILIREFVTISVMATARDESRWTTGIPKNGTVVPNRVFVGGITGDIKEQDLTNLFSMYGNVKSTKIIFNNAGETKGFGFVTFETVEEAQKVLKEVDCVNFEKHKLNVAAAFKKQPYSRSTLESNSVPSNSIVWPTQPYSASSAGCSRDSIYYPQATWPVVWPPQFYLQQCHYPSSTQASYPQYVYSIAPTDYPFQAIGSVSGSDYSESSDSNEGKSIMKASAPHATEYDRDRSTKANQVKASSPQRFNSTSSGLDTSAGYMHSTPLHSHRPVFAKTVNGVAVMAYPSSFVMGSPALVHVKDGSGESENVLTELGFLHSPGAYTPPATPLESLSCEFNANASIESLRKN